MSSPCAVIQETLSRSGNSSQVIGFQMTTVPLCDVSALSLVKGWLSMLGRSFHIYEPEAMTPSWNEFAA